MTISSETSGGNTAITIVRTFATAKVQAGSNQLMKVLHRRAVSYYPRENGNLIPVNSLTNQQKLNTLETYIFTELKAVIDGSYVDEQVDVTKAIARATAEADLLL